MHVLWFALDNDAKGEVFKLDCLYQCLLKHLNKVQASGKCFRGLFFPFLLLLFLVMNERKAHKYYSNLNSSNFHTATAIFFYNFLSLLMTRNACISERT
jgi:hypothetical protein